MNKLRPGLPPLPPRIKDLDIDKRGFPVPFFVQWIEGEPKFQIMDREKWKACVSRNLCWICGQRLAARKVFVIGPMCGVTRTTSEPPSHIGCAEFALKACPFLINPEMRRNAKALEPFPGASMAGQPILRNPGVSMAWTAGKFQLFGDGRGGALINIGPPSHVSFWAEGRRATMIEIEASLRSGVPFLETEARREGPKALNDLAQMLTAFIVNIVGAYG